MVDQEDLKKETAVTSPLINNKSNRYVLTSCTLNLDLPGLD